MKKLIAIALVLVMTLGLCACGSQPLRRLILRLPLRLRPPLPLSQPVLLRPTPSRPLSP